MEKNHVIYLEDEKSMQKIFKNLLADYDLNITCIYTATEFLARMKNEGHDYDYIFVDETLCGESMTGSNVIGFTQDYINGAKVYFITSIDKATMWKSVVKYGLKKVIGIIEKDNLKEELSKIFEGFKINGRH